MNLFQAFEAVRARFFSALAETTDRPDDFSLYGRDVDFVSKITGNMPALVKGVLNQAGPDDYASREALLRFYYREIEKMSPEQMVILVRANVVEPHRKPRPSSP